MARNYKLIFLFVSLVLIVSFIYVHNTYFRYSKEDWNNNIDRHKMTKSIIKTNLITNKTYTETIEELGEPSFIREDSETTTLVYLTGGGNYIDLEELCIKMKQDSVVQVYLNYN